MQLMFEKGLVKKIKQQVQEKFHKLNPDKHCNFIKLPY